MTQSQAQPLYSLDQGAVGKASKADWKPVCHSLCSMDRL